MKDKTDIRKEIEYAFIEYGKMYLKGHPYCMTLDILCKKVHWLQRSEVRKVLTIMYKTFGFEDDYWYLKEEVQDDIRCEYINRDVESNDLGSSLEDIIDPGFLYCELKHLSDEEYNKFATRLYNLSQCNLENIKLSSDDIMLLVENTSDEEYQSYLETFDSLESPVKTIYELFCYRLLHEMKTEMEELKTEREELKASYEKLISKKKNIKHKISFGNFIVKTYIFKCNLNHSIENITASVEIMTTSGDVVVETVSAGYCKTCDCYFILEKDYEKLRAKGILLCQQISYDVFIKNGKSIMNGEDLKPESLLHQCGYNVSSVDDLTSVQRQAILRRVLDNGLYSKSGICSHLDWLIARNMKVSTRDMSTAISKWQEDREYISSYKSSNGRNVNVKSVTKKNYY